MYLSSSCTLSKICFATFYIAVADFVEYPILDDWTCVLALCWLSNVCTVFIHFVPPVNFMLLK